MKKITNYQNKKVLVVGLAKSGLNAAKLLKDLGAFVTVNDHKKIDDNPEAKELLAEGIKVITGGHPLSLLDEDFELVVKNPGIPYTNPLIAKAMEKGLPIITEPELAYEISEAPMIGVTGTNGKTTTTTLISLMLNQERKQGQAFMAGNIGIPSVSVARKATKNDIIVTELSSFQLCGIDQLKPEIAVITNIYEAHTDYHQTRENYVKAKMRITENQDSDDFLVVNWDLEELHELVKASRAQIVPFSRLDKIETGAYVKDDNIYYQDELIMKTADINIPGEHNIENALAAITVVKIKGVTNSAIKEVLSTFTGVRHRTQFVSVWHNRKFYNDSKATNIEATEMAVKGFSQPIILLAGGLDRGFTFEKLVPVLKEHVKAMIVFGETADLMRSAGEAAGITEIKQVTDVVAAVPEAYKLSADNDIILLSPAAASWDQYPSFEVRGDEYIDAVEKLMQEKDN
ncbi:UDP-N-acetylmuramoyl-L-alanine--D-glutamate ligase [Dellaglioa sp. BT-FLS60]